MATIPTAANTGTFLTSTLANIYTSPAGTTSVISNLTLTNTSNSTCICDVHLSSSNVSSATSELIQVTVPNKSTIKVNVAINHAVQPTGAVLASASIDNVVIAKLSVVKFN